MPVQDLDNTYPSSVEALANPWSYFQKLISGPLELLPRRDHIQQNFPGAQDRAASPQGVMELDAEPGFSPDTVNQILWRGYWLQLEYYLDLWAVDFSGAHEFDGKDWTFIPLAGAGPMIGGQSLGPVDGSNTTGAWREFIPMRREGPTTGDTDSTVFSRQSYFRFTWGAAIEEMTVEISFTQDEADVFLIWVFDFSEIAELRDGDLREFLEAPLAANFGGALLSFRETRMRGPGSLSFPGPSTVNMLTGTLVIDEDDPLLPAGWWRHQGKEHYMRWHPMYYDADDDMHYPDTGTVREWGLFPAGSQFPGTEVHWVISNGVLQVGILITPNAGPVPRYLWTVDWSEISSDADGELSGSVTFDLDTWYITRN